MSEPKDGSPKGGAAPISRRTAMKLAGGAVGVAAFARAISPLTALADELSPEEFVQRHYKELTPEDKQRVFARLEEQAKEKYGVPVRIGDPPPLPNTRFAYALNLSLCIGCRQCSEACHRENNHDRRSHNSYIRVFEIEKGSLELAKGNSSYTHPVPQPDKTYMPVQCHHCDEPPCVDVCPVRATWKEPDGIVVIDYNWCIGCRYCEAACPYHARRFNWHEPEITGEEINPDQGYLSNRARMKGVMEKCTFCLHRTRRGRLPACLEACPAGARVFVLKEEQGTVPSFYYFFSV